MAQYLQALSPEQLDAANVNQYLRNQKIIALTLGLDIRGLHHR